MGYVNICEQVKAEVSPEKTAEVMEALEYAFRRLPACVQCDEDDHSFRLSGIEAGFSVAHANLELKEKNGKYLLEGSVSGEPSARFWIFIAVGCLLMFVSMLILWPLFFGGLAMVVVTVLQRDKQLPDVGCRIVDSFRKAVRR